MLPRYVFVYAPDHPLAPPSGQMPEHRKLLFDRIGPGPHPCNWCGTSLNWTTERRTGGDALLTDHVDGDGLNNAPENLVPSCNPCNTRRGHDRRMGDQLILVTARGRTLAVERTCAVCGETFLVAKTNIESAPEGVAKGSACSRRCANTAKGRANAERDRAASETVAPRMWELRDSGLSYNAIAAALNDAGVQTARGNSWSASSVYTVMQRTDPARHEAERAAREVDLAALYVVRNGVRHKAVKRTCENVRCGKDFLVIAATLSGQKTKGRFCSRDCHYASRRKTAD